MCCDYPDPKCVNNRFEVLKSVYFFAAWTNSVYQMQQVILLTEPC